MFRQTALSLFRHQTRAFQSRAFCTTPIVFQKGPVEGAKDAIKSVDRAVSDTIVAGIEKGEEAAESAKKAAGAGKEKAEDVKEEAKDKAQDVKEEAKQKAGEAKQEAKK